jgi:hypothetical protein
MSVTSPVVSTNHLSNSEMTSQETATSPLPPNMIRSPYENVVIPAPGTIVHPQSPRTRIRTIAPSAKYVDCLKMLTDPLHCGGTFSCYKIVITMKMEAVHLQT